ncbi:Methyl-accepting chemotaxis protein PctB [Marinomonas spartinae]|uniref:Methyl-accepting chemotaxis protein PctB n=1 Tax=Marinomonas spartinae TaxID=1792290 RepID=A0A1A8T4Q0_9GAMM|nr:methyl-accepting chemotaxis protein [Marinomonas spartinae]SBS26499.1 Methyl-accepting chemotaxis protein PctB [Marinomonas spartinae]SBS40173.1 Methyl-accepting chemotaxis protein PctB [Marinomonas spartinae]
MNINKKMWVLSGATAISIILVGVFAAYILSSLRVDFGHYKSQIATSQQLFEMKATGLSVAKGDPILPSTKTALDAANVKINALLKSIEASHVIDKKKSKLLKQIKSLWAEYFKQFNSAINMAQDSPQDALQIPDSIYGLYLLPMINDIDQLVKENQGLESSSDGIISKQMAMILWLILTPLVAGGLFVVASQRLLARDLRKRVFRVLDVVKFLEQGDLTKRLPVEGRDELSSIASSVNGFVDKTHSILCQVRESTSDVSNAASELFDASAHVANSASSQNEAASSVAATVQQLAVSIGQVTEHAKSAQSFSVQSGELSTQAGGVVLSATNEMNKISEYSRGSSSLIKELEDRSSDISNIMQVIKDVADQTNLLALNAAIEAARAGEQGRGFSVVADEIRNLAMRTTQSTSEIAQIVGQIQEATEAVSLSMESGLQRVEQGVLLAQQAGQSMNDVTESTVKVEESIDYICNALTEQDHASDDIARKIDRIAMIIREDAESAKNTVETAKKLDGLSGTLNTAVSQFQL